MLGNYFERMAFSVHKDVGSREHRFKLDDPRFLTEDFNNVDAQHLKVSVESFIDKLEIVSHSSIRTAKKANVNSQRISKLEEATKDYFTLFSFRQMMDEYEAKFNERLEQRLSHLAATQKNMQSELTETKN